MKEQFLSKMGISCFAEHKDDLLMWAHYGGRYEGFCLEFRTEYAPFDNNKLQKVNYVDEMPHLNVCKILMGDQMEELMKLYCVKSRAWAYEREWRAMHREAGKLYGYDARALKAIYFGPNMDSQTKEILCLILKDQVPSVELWNVIQRPDRFSLAFQQFNFTTFGEAQRLGLISPTG